MAERIILGADHGGYALKEKIKKWLVSSGYAVEDRGSHSEDACDYPLIGFDVARAVSGGKFKRGILFCRSGIGMAIVANKLPRVRAAVCNTPREARSSREHNDTNVLSLASDYIDLSKAKRIIRTWLTTKALGGRHARRVRQIVDMDKKIKKFR